MSLTEEIFSEVKAISKTQEIREHGRYTTGTAIFDVTNFDVVLGSINQVVDPIVKNGEKIACQIEHGEVIDSNIKGFEILKGVSIELYDYPSTTASFIRLYHLKDKGKEWLALYIDENPETPWWTKEERLG
ncbi:MAG: hypothetical protein ACE5PM_06065 [Candidatus Hydrothermarchaeales archaeon]